MQLQVVRQQQIRLDDEIAHQTFNSFRIRFKFQGRQSATMCVRKLARVSWGMFRSISFCSWSRSVAPVVLQIRVDPDLRFSFIRKSSTMPPTLTEQQPSPKKTKVTEDDVVAEKTASPVKVTIPPSLIS